MIKKVVSKREDVGVNESSVAAKRLKLNSKYYDAALDKEISYEVTNVAAGSAIMAFAGLASGVLGIGSGPFKVVAMDGVMKMPMKVSTSTSNLMMGVTACASALVYFFKGTILPQLAVPLALGVLLGSTIGSRIMPHVKPKIIRIIFIPLLAIIALQMILRAFGVF